VFFESAIIVLKNTGLRSAYQFLGYYKPSTMKKNALSSHQTIVTIMNSGRAAPLLAAGRFNQEFRLK